MPEQLENRELPTFFLPTSLKLEEFKFGGAAYLISVAGPGIVRARVAPKVGIILNLAGTTQDTSVVVQALGSKSTAPVKPLAIEQINIRTQRLGSFQGLTSADLLGSMSPLLGPVNSLQFDSIGPSAQIIVTGNLNQLLVNRDAQLGSSGLIQVSGDITGSVSITGNLVLDGGRFSVGRDLSGSLNVGGDLRVLDGGSLVVNRNLGNSTGGGGASSSGASGSSPASGSSTSGGSGGVSITGNIFLGNGEFFVGRNVSSLSVLGNLDTSSGGSISVAGNLSSLTVAGFIRGKSKADIFVGGNLGQLTVLGGGNAGGGIQHVDLNVGANAQGLDIRSGVFSSQINAGNLIDGGSPGSGANGWNIGPSGSVAVYDSAMIAGVEIRNITIGGNVVSDNKFNPSGAPTRIVAGESQQGLFRPGGVIDNFQIVGSLINSVIAASVQPAGGSYHQPAGQVVVGIVAAVSNTPTGTPPPVVQEVSVPNFTAPPFANLEDIVLPGGAINPTFAAPFQLVPPNAPAGTKLPLPSKPTVTGTVITTTMRNGADYAGLFAANTNGIFVGPLPTS